MKTSATTSQISEALAKAQGMMAAAAKDTANTFYRSRYADLASVWEACRGPLASNGLSVAQFPATVCDETGRPVIVEVPPQAKDDTGHRMMVKVVTLLSHTSGEWFASELIVPVARIDPQGSGSGITYARRYTLMAMVGVAPDDEDDGNAASGRTDRDHRQPQAPPRQFSGGGRRQPEPSVGEQMQERVSQGVSHDTPKHEPADRILAKTLGKVYGCKTEEDCTLLCTTVSADPEMTWPAIRKQPDLAFPVSDQLRAYCEFHAVKPEDLLSWVKGLATANTEAMAESV